MKKGEKHNSNSYITSQEYGKGKTRKREKVTYRIHKEETGSGNSIIDAFINYGRKII